MKTLLVCAVLVLGFGTANAQEPQRIELMPYLHDAGFVPKVDSYSTSESALLEDEILPTVEVRFYEAEIYTETGELIASEWWLTQDPKANYLVEIELTTSGAMSQNFADSSISIFGGAVGACFTETISQAEVDALAAKMETGIDAAFSQGQGTFAYATESVSWRLELTYHLDGFHTLLQLFRFTGPVKEIEPHCTLEKVDTGF